MAERLGKTDEAWQRILDKYPIEERTRDGGLYEIQAEQIKAFREPRLMTKFDTSESVAQPLKNLGLNVLPVSRRSYVLGKFDLYEKFPSDPAKGKPEFVPLPDYETLRPEDISSESNAINALMVSGTLARFLGEQEDDGLVETFNGRMGSGDFSFGINGTSKPIQVSKAQLEIDGGFESQHSVCIMEAKNIRHDDFNIRQLYFPYRKYRRIVKKPIRLVFSQYTNSTYHLYEYEFTEPDSFSSIQLVDTRVYTFEDQSITDTDLAEAWEATPVTTDDNQHGTDIPFIQADKFDRVVSLVEHLGSAEEQTLTTEEIARFLGVTPRQAAYYPTAGEYLGLFERPKRGLVSLTDTARKILGMGYRDRQLAYVRLMAEHRIFHDLFEDTRKNGRIPDKKSIEQRMLELDVCNDGSTASRRAQTVLSWLKWVFALPDDA